jgi:hypothetical protein
VAPLDGGSLVEPQRSRRLFGFVVATSVPFPVDAETCRGSVDLTFEITLHPLLSASPSRPALIYESLAKAVDGTSLTRLYRLDGREIFRFHEAGDFLVEADRIEADLSAARLDLAELRFLGPVLSYWFERRGLPTLHASAVAIDGRGVAFVSRHGGGKSGLAVAMVRAGWALVTDDLLVLENRKDRWEARPSYPEIRMWPDEAKYFVGSPEALPLVQSDSGKRRVGVGGIGEGGFGSFHNASVPLACIYLASRRPEADGGVEIQPVSRSEALIELVRHSFSPRLVEAAGLQPSRLDRLSRLVRQVPVRRLSYPSGFERLPEVAEALLGSW